ncbi:Catalyzes the cleavage of p-aminobenzoyl-glutamate to p-aminobenzoate and glutamate, subunit A [Campylobacter concisus UNSW3]|uniref:Catalyzes the cleavage of p-aminobenzoyl-glutamate to p-aminobenzoate and glutamate, subunit A n=1 Tax=Campylobacter concisus UNSW3 TaxID=1242966 RepID=U2EYW0_9BACT|nr:amidohydrolase [Campylobacter concisus]ERJ22855.1 Catalyzes the cleavage of p-aminobenzoyl-glutamate to p-aminobenzoate and glutamate, subunit A [Campylobacter concisus UNSW3]
MDKIANLALSLKEDMIKDRRYFHSHPETGWFTFFTTAVLAKRLSELGYEVKLGEEVVKSNARLGVGSKEQCQKAIERAKSLLNPDEAKYLECMKDGLTGLTAFIDTKRPGKFSAFRFDIDSVDVTESEEAAHRPCKEGFGSDITGITHACGHDGHMAMGLALAKLIAKNLDEFNGKFKFIFQTAEEGTRGAVAMEAAGVLDGVEYLLGGHIGFQAETNRGIICGTNKLLATSKFDVHITGRSAHAAGAPEEGANALLAAAQMALNMHGITRHAKGVTRINVGVLRAGEGRNVIAPNGYLACETRGEDTNLNEFMYKKCMDIVKGVSEIYGVESKVVMTGGTSGANSDKEVTEIFYEAAKQSPFIDDDKIVKELDFGACEDFAHFMRALQDRGAKSGYMMIGTNLKAGHHNSKFDFDEECLVAGVDIYLRAAYKLNGVKK